MNSEKITERDCCAPKPNINERPLLTNRQAANLEAVFKDLANSNRLRLLHELIRKPGICVGEIAKSLGMKTPAISNNLRRLTDRGIVAAQRSGKQICYRIIDPCIVSILDHGLCLTEDLNGAQKDSRAA